MKYPTLTLSKQVAVTTLVLFFICTGHAAPPSKALGKQADHSAMKHQGKGGMPGDFKKNIHALFSDHKKITRKVELTKSGYRAITTSDDPKIVATLQKHVKQMQGRLEQGRGVRRWDPAYAEMMDHYQDIEVKITAIKNGIQAEMIGTTDEAVKIAQNHAAVLSKFVDNGDSEMHKKHVAVVDLALNDSTESGSNKGCAGEKCCLSEKKANTAAKTCCKDKQAE